MRLAVITGADSVYFDLMHELLRTLSAADIDLDYALCVLDFGLLPEQTALAERYGAAVKCPKWRFDAPDALKTDANLSYATRPLLPHCFPGYDIYLWLDADISVQDGRFISTFVEAALEGRLAIAEEVDPCYRLEPYALKWQIGNAFRCFGFRGGLALCRGRPINSGVFALRSDAPHWSKWQERYQQAIDHTHRANLDQHALMAALYLDEMPCHYLNSTYNWICGRSQPLWDEARQVFCRPHAPFEKINVLHLAGREKNKLWDIKTRAGAIQQMRLSYISRQAAVPPAEPEAA
ncbi:MAG: hypothetical protein ACR2QH_00500 [Geminicoccaceae bacterium]